MGSWVIGMLKGKVFGYYALTEERFMRVTLDGLDRLHPVSLQDLNERIQGRGKEVLLVGTCMQMTSFHSQGKGWRLHEVAALERRFTLVFVCPELLGHVPRAETGPEIEPGHDGNDVLDGRAKVLSREGVDMTPLFILGAHRTLAIARNIGASMALFKDGCASCGVHTINDSSSRSGERPGRGVTSAHLARQDIKVLSYRRMRTSSRKHSREHRLHVKSQGA